MQSEQLYDGGWLLGSSHLYVIVDKVSLFLYCLSIYISKSKYEYVWANDVNVPVIQNTRIASAIVLDYWPRSDKKKWPGLITFPAFVAYCNDWIDNSFSWTDKFF